MNTTALLIVLAVSVFAVLCALAYFGLAAYRLVRTGLRAAAATRTRVAPVADRAALAQTKTATLAENGGRLGNAAAHLQSSLARLSVLTGAIAEARAPWQRMTGFLKQK